MKFYLFLFFTFLFVSTVSLTNPSTTHSISNDANTPPNGTRSVFDFYTSNETGDRSYQVSFPIEKLWTEIKSKGIWPVTSQDAIVTEAEEYPVALLPFSRSLQAKFVDFAQPRILLRANRVPDVTPKNLGVNLFNRLYIGYSEKAKRLEVIGYNEKAGRFEFQIVENYGKGLIPKILYANRSLCITCHQSKAPIFNAPMWRETNQDGGFAGGAVEIDARMLDGLKKSASGRETYHGFNLKGGLASAFQSAVSEANNFSIWNDLWTTGCGPTSVKGNECREKILEEFIVAIFSAKFDYPAHFGLPRDNPNLSKKLDSLAQKVKQLTEIQIKRTFPDGILQPQPIIDDRDPFSNQKADINSPFIKERLASYSDPVIREAVRKSIIETGLFPEQIPFTPRKLSPVELDLQIENFVYVGLINYLGGVPTISLLKSAAKGNLSAITSEMRNLVGDGTSPSVFDNKPFVRAQFVLAMLRLLGVSAKELPFAPEEKPVETLSPVEVVQESGGIEDPLLIESERKVLRLFVNYCGACHSDGTRNFLGFSGHENIAQIRSFGTTINKALNWESKPAPGRPMPLGRWRQMLEAHPEDRKAMLEFTQKL